MAEVISLRLVRKARRRAKAAGAAAENRARAGRGAAEKRLDRARKESLERRLDSHRLDFSRERERSR
jgi:hypothetical protein